MKWKDVWLEDPNGPQLGYVFRVFVGNLDPRSLVFEELWLETGIVMCSGHHVEVWSGGNKRRVARPIRWVRDGVMCECVCVLGLVDGRGLSCAKNKVAGSS